jgi:hypothetical protein
MVRCGLRVRSAPKAVSPSVHCRRVHCCAHITAVIAQSHAAYMLQRMKAFSTVIVPLEVPSAARHCIALVVRDWAHRGTACVEIDVDVLVGPPAAFNAFGCAADPIRASVQMVPQYNCCICASPVTVYAAANDSVGLPQCRRRTSTGTFRRFCSSSCKKALALSVAECSSRCLPTCHSGHVSASDGPVVLLSSQNLSVRRVLSR